MAEIFDTYKPQLITFVMILIGFGIVYGIITLTFKLLIRRTEKRAKDPHMLRLIRRVLRIVLTISTLFSIAILITGKEYEKVLSENSNLIWYIGFILVIGIIVAHKVESYFKNKVKHLIESNEDPTSYRFLRYLAVFAVYFTVFILIILAFPSLTGLAKTALGGAGVIALVVGLASQEIFANIIGGVFIISFKPFRINDVIKISDNMIGTVTDITLRHTVIKDFENKVIIVPNNLINKEKLVNFDVSDRRICQWIEVGISYDSDVDLALKILQEKCEAHPLVIDTRTEEAIANGTPKVIVRVVKLDDSSVNLKAWAWAATFGDGFQMKCDLFYQIKKAYDENGIEIPFPHRTMVFKEKQLGALANKSQNKD